METRRARFDPEGLALPLGLVGGVVAAQALQRPSILGAVALGAAGAALARGRWLVLGAALGLLAGWCRTAPPLAGIDIERPVVAVVRQETDWRRLGAVWSAGARIERVRQEAVVVRWGVRVRLSLPGDEEPTGRRWRLRGMLGRPAPLGNGVRVRPPPLRLRVKSSRWVEPAGGRSAGDRLRQGLSAARSSLRVAVLAAAPDHPGARLVRALVLGDREALPESWIRGLRRTGTAHLVALSGLHLAVVGGWCLWAARPLSRRGRWAALLLGTLAYVAVGGARPSLLRAWLMVVAAGAAALGRRPARPAHGLAWAAAALAWHDPSLVTQVGYRLTCAATAGVLLGARWLPTRWPEAPRGVSRLLGASLGAQIATLPITLPAFHWLPLWSWAWNLLHAPAVAFALPLCLAWVLLARVAPTLAGEVVAPLDLAATWLALPAALPPGWGGGVPWCGSGVGLSLAALAALTLAPPRALPAAAVLAGLALMLGPKPHAADPRVHFVDVGQGDATLLTSGGAGLLVDGGGWRAPGVAERALLPVLGRLRLRRLEVVVLTHGDRDHCGGLVELADYVPFGEVWMPPGTARERCGRRLVANAAAAPRPLWAGEAVRWREWSFTALNPPPGRRGDGNEDSLVLRAESGARSLLLTGDVGTRTEAGILRRSSVAPASLLKVAHHGSSTSSSARWLAAVDPRLAVISAGRGNPFGHPSPAVLARLGASGTAVLRTDRSGLVALRWRADGRWRIETPGAVP